MGLLDSILGAASGKSGASGEANPLIGIVGGLLAQSGVCRVWPINLHRVARGTHSNRGLGWVKTSRFPAIKFKTCLVPSRSMRSRPEWEWILPLRQPSWLSTCQRSSTS